MQRKIPQWRSLEEPTGCWHDPRNDPCVNIRPDNIVIATFCRVCEFLYCILFDKIL